MTFLLDLDHTTNSILEGGKKEKRKKASFYRKFLRLRSYTCKANALQIHVGFMCDNIMYSFDQDLD